MYLIIYCKTDSNCIELYMVTWFEKCSTFFRKEHLGGIFLGMFGLLICTYQGLSFLASKLNTLHEDI